VTGRTGVPVPVVGGGVPEKENNIIAIGTLKLAESIHLVFTSPFKKQFFLFKVSYPVAKNLEQSPDTWYRYLDFKSS
jgi:hypothetical protein